ncbi:MAG: hypothetical protein QNJ33_02150 [Crocosphaera sp.]|nr:hypothetical protein [Crocosphaera sp.]
MVMTQGAFDTLGCIYEEPVTNDDSLYQYFLKLIETESPCDVLEKLRLLLEQTRNYPDPEVQEMVKNLIYSPTAKANCLSFFNHLCQACIASWIVNPKTKPAIFQLLNSFENLYISPRRQKKFLTRWQEESQAFSETSEYLKLQRLTRIINPRIVSDAAKPQILGDLLGRYPFLYKDCLLDNDSVEEYINFLAGFKRHQQNSFQQKLNRTIILQKQKIEVARLRTLTTKVPQPIQVVPNPTLLNHQAFSIAIETFTQLTQNQIKSKKGINFFSEIESLSFKEFKIWLINYLIEDIEEASKQQLKQYLQENIPTILTHCDQQTINEFLILRTCNQLLNKLILNPTQPSHHLSFINLKRYLGTTQLTALLLKLIFLNSQLKDSLRQRLAHLFNYYESTSIEESLWFIQVLENCLVAFAVTQENTTIM